MLVLIFVVFIFVSLGFEHSIANMGSGLGHLSRTSQATSEKRGFRSPRATFGGGHVPVPT
jgi:formate/nitrite transporter FocA (FNT family)